MLSVFGYAVTAFGFAGLVLYIAPLARLAGVAPALSARAASVATGINTKLAAGLKWAALLIVLTEALVVVLRYVFRASFIWMQEAVVYLHGGLFLLAAGYALHVGAHVRVDVFRRMMSPRASALVDLLGVYLMLLPVCVAIVWTSGPYVADSWAVLEGSSEGSGIAALFLLKSCIPAFAVFLALQGLAVADRAAATLRSGAAQTDEAR